MLLSDNTKKVVDLIHQFDNLSNIDKVRLAIYLLENWCIKSTTFFVLSLNNIYILLSF